MFKGDTGLGRVKVQVKDTKLKLSNKITFSLIDHFKGKKAQANLARNMNSQNVGGLTSSVVMSTTRGIELINPSLAQIGAQKKGPEK